LVGSSFLDAHITSLSAAVIARGCSDGQLAAAEKTRTETWLNHARSRLNFEVVAPVPETFLDAAGQKAPKDMAGRSILNLLMGTERPGVRATVFIERERHANVHSSHST
jgi:hypothetical protein